MAVMMAITVGMTMVTKMAMIDSNGGNGGGNDRNDGGDDGGDDGQW